MIISSARGLTRFLVALAAFNIAVPAFAHITLEDPEAVPGTTYRAVLRVPHGCEGAATTGIHVQIPEAFEGAKPMPHAGWTLSVDAADDASGAVRTIHWTGGNLADAYYDEFVFRGKISGDAAVGSTLFFPTVQDCETGQTRWENVMGATGDGEPAPSLKLIAGAVDDAHQGMAMGSSPATMIGDLEISGGFVRAMLPGASSGGGYLNIHNLGGETERLISASSPVAEKVLLHEMTMNGQVMEMRPLPDGIAIASGETVALSPTGSHLMFTGVATPFAEGGKVSVTLVFEKAGAVTIELPVGGIAADMDDTDEMAGMAGMAM